jgi:DNA-binding MurR/RpiR family transcriptional regulator
MKNNFTKKYLSDINSTLNDLSQQDFNNFLKLIKNAKKQIIKLFLLVMVGAQR